MMYSVTVRHSGLGIGLKFLKV